MTAENWLYHVTTSAYLLQHVITEGKRKTNWYAL